MPSISTSSTGSPIHKLPYEILLEIFNHCLPPQPQYSFKEHPEPDPAIAPILLCHICSSWRAIALTAPTLWTCLSYCFTIVMGDDYDTYSTSGAFTFLAQEIEFVRWWRANQGHVAPSLDFGIYECNVSDLERREKAGDTTSDGMDLLLEAIFAARFLDLDEFFWCRIEEHIRAGHRVAFPHVHTLLMMEATIDNEALYTVLRLLPDNAFPALHRISIVHPDEIAFPESVHTLQRWSMAVTDVFLHASISPDFWFACLGGFPNLRYGSFTIDSSSAFYDAQSGRTVGCTLLQLATLHVGIGDDRQLNKGISPLTLLFSNLHLPALHTLSLSKNTRSSWADNIAINDLDTVLRATPALTTLCLEDNFLVLCPARSDAIGSAPGGAPPIWHRAPRLAHVQLYVGFYAVSDRVPMELVVEMFVCGIVGAEGGWLRLQDPACPIQSLTIGHRTDDQRRFKDVVVARLRESAGSLRVVFRAPEFSMLEDLV